MSCVGSALVALGGSSGGRASVFRHLVGRLGFEWQELGSGRDQRQHRSTSVPGHGALGVRRPGGAHGFSVAADAVAPCAPLPPVRVLRTVRQDVNVGSDLLPLVSVLLLFLLLLDAVSTPSGGIPASQCLLLTARGPQGAGRLVSQEVSLSGQRAGLCTGTRVHVCVHTVRTERAPGGPEAPLSSCFVLRAPTPQPVSASGPPRARSGPPLRPLWAGTVIGAPQREVSWGVAAPASSGGSGPRGLLQSQVPFRVPVSTSVAAGGVLMALGCSRAGSLVSPSGRSGNALAPPHSARPGVAGGAGRTLSSTFGVLVSIAGSSSFWCLELASGDLARLVHADSSLRCCWWVSGHPLHTGHASAQRDGAVPSSLTWCHLPSPRHTAQPAARLGGGQPGGRAFREEPPVRPLRMPSAGASLEPVQVEAVPLRLSC